MNRLQAVALDTLLRYVATNPMDKLPALFSIAERLDRGHIHAEQMRTLREAVMDGESAWHRLFEGFFRDVNTHCLKKFVECFIFNASLDGEARARAVEAEYDCNVPWAILMDPTSACNLSCTGCWAAQYGHKNTLAYDVMDSVCRQGKELGIYFYIFSGGEPLVRKRDVIRLCSQHQDSYFLSFTNGTLVNDAFCEDLVRLGNFTLAFSIEGDEEATDMRRGAGTYRKVVSAMERMRAHRLPFGYSTCYHRYNTESVGSDEFVDSMIALGCRFAWNFTYVPVGRDAKCDLLVTPEQRAYMYRRIREIRDEKPILALDFWNDGEYVNGCIAGGRRYLHINAAGDVEPCAFIHYSNANIHDTTLLEALKSPLFMAYRKNQPFNENHLRPCPLLDNPETLASMVKESKASSTEMETPEDVDALCARTAPAARRWACVADRMWENRDTSEGTASQTAVIDG